MKRKKNINNFKKFRIIIRLIEQTILIKLKMKKKKNFNYKSRILKNNINMRKIKRK